MVFQNEKRFWHIVYAYIPIALIGIFFLGWIITPSYYTLIFLGVIPFFFLLWNNKIGQGDVKGSFLYSLPLLWPFVGDFIFGLYKYGSEVLSHWQWSAYPSTLSSWGIFDNYFWHPFIIISFSCNLFFLHIFQTSLQRNIKPKWSILATTCIWTLFFESFIWIDGGLPWDIQSIIISMAILASLFLICSFASYKSNSIAGQVILLGIFMSVYV